MTDDIIHALGRYSGLRVISRNSVQQFKQREAPPRVVNAELGARYVVTGSVREADGQLRVAAELSDAYTARGLVVGALRPQGRRDLRDQGQHCTEGRRRAGRQGDEIRK